MPDIAIRREVISEARQIVVKVGTSTITDDSGRSDRSAISHLAGQIAKVRKRGISVTLVVSGAIGAGMGELDLARRPTDMPALQAVAAVGQGQLMRAFHDAFARRDVKTAQVLVTRDDFEDRTRYLNIRNTLRALGEYDAIAVINENDAVAVDEIRYGDNDIIAAHVTNMLGADLLVLLTNVDGVIKDGRVLDVVEQVDSETLALVSGQKSRFGSGGMATKLAAAEIVTRAGVAAVIAPAATPRVLTRLLDGERLGTVFVPAHRKVSSRLRWIGQASRPAGTITVDDGAAKALGGGKSLLPSGISAVTGTFGKGATVAIVAADGREIARGLTNYPSAQIEKIKGLKTDEIDAVLGDKPYDEVIHRNNMMLR